jgi:hypothetical protein
MRDGRGSNRSRDRQGAVHRISHYTTRSKIYSVAAEIPPVFGPEVGPVTDRPTR